MDSVEIVTTVEVPAEVMSGVVYEEDTEILAPGEADAAEMGELPVEDWDYQRPRRGQVRTGVILAIDEQEILVDVGVKRDGVVPFADMQRMGAEALAELSVGETVPVYILRPEDQDGNLLVSLYMARQEKSWLSAQEMAETGKVLEDQVIGYNKGGLVFPVGEIQGFIPASQVPGFPHGLNQEERLARLSNMVGETLLVKVIEINRRKRRLILSATAAQRQWRKQQRRRLLDELREGEVRQGVVSSLCSFGAFVDLGGADGLVHLSELSWRRVRHPREVVSVGDKVEVYVLRLDQERKRIGLSLKRLQPEPWALVEDKYELGQLVEGTVTNVVDFGAFAEIEEGVEGLIHVSELSDGPISHSREVVKKGDFLLLRIIRIDTRRKRLGLSLKRVLESEWAEWAARLAIAEAEREGEAKEREALRVEETEEPAAMVAEEQEEEEERESREAAQIEEPAVMVAEEPEEVGEKPEALEAAQIEEPAVMVAEEAEEEGEEPEALEAAQLDEPAVMVAEEPEEEGEEPEALEAAEIDEPAVMVAEEPEEEEQEPELVEVAQLDEPAVMVAEEPEEEGEEPESPETGETEEPAVMVAGEMGEELEEPQLPESEDVEESMATMAEEPEEEGDERESLEAGDNEELAATMSGAPEEEAEERESREAETAEPVGLVSDEPDVADETAELVHADLQEEEKPEPLVTEAT
jgi:small subunit ribosomal protein S1